MVWFFYIIVIVSFFLLSIAQGLYNIDPHHWGLMLSNANDLLKGKLPYEYIFIQYGFLTTVIQAFSLWIYYNLVSIFIITCFFYFCANLILIKIIHKENILYRFQISLIIILFSPIVLYPWSNYLSYFFIIFSLYLFYKDTLNYDILGSFILSLGVLCRESIFLSSLCIILTVVILRIIKSKHNIKFSFIYILKILLMYLLPIIIFICYLEFNNITQYWIIYSYKLPRVYMQEFYIHMHGFYIFTKLLSTIISGFINLDIKWIFIGLIISLNVYLLIDEIVGFVLTRSIKNKFVILVSVYSITLLTSMLHLSEVFRFTTGSIIGIINLHYFLNKKLYNLKVYVNSFLSISIVFFLLQDFRRDDSNLYFPTKTNLLESHPDINIDIFSHQLWSKDTKIYYEYIYSSLITLGNNCKVKYHFNDTKDAYIQVLSPFKQLQIAPFGTNNSSIDKLRQDLDYDNAIKSGDIIVIRSFPSNEFPVIPDGYLIYAKIPVPVMFWIEQGFTLYIFAPHNNCLN